MTGVQTCALPILNTYTNYGLLTLILCDRSDWRKQYKLDEMYYSLADGAIIMYDLTSIDTFNEAVKEIEYIRKVNQEAFIVLCGNKSDKHIVTPKDININVPHCKISVMFDHDILEPLFKVVEGAAKYNLILTRSPIPKRAFPIELMLNALPK